jgi:ankyrin repeat protein
MEPEVNRFIKDAPLLLYACHEWGHHAAVGFDPAVDESIKQFLSSGFPVEFWVGILQARLSSSGSKYDRGDEWQQEATYVKRGISRLHIAAIYGIKPLAERCVSDQTTEANPRDLDLVTPLMAAAGLGRGEVFDLLLARCCDADANATDANGFTALVHAVKGSHLELVQKLLNSPIAVDVNKGSPLTFTVNHLGPKQNRRILTLLLEQPHLNPNQWDQHHEEKRPPWYHIATGWHFDNLASLLAKPGFDPWQWGSPADHLMDFRGYLRSSCYSAEWSISQCDAFAMVRLLDSDARFPMEQHMALELLWPAVYYAFTDILPDMNGDLDWMWLIDRDDILRNGFKQLFTEHGISLDFVDSSGCGFLHYLAYEGHDEYIKFLLNRGVDADRADNNGQTPLFQAVEQGHESTVRLLLEAGATPSTNDADGWTVLHSAAWGGNKSIVEMLIGRGAKANVTNNRKESVLHAATRSKKGFEVIPLLLGHGADLNVTDIFGASALDEAVRAGCEPTCRALLESGASLTASQFSIHLLSSAAVTFNAGVNKLLLSYMDANDEAAQTIYGISVLDFLSQYPEEIASGMGYMQSNNMPTYKPTPAPARRQRLLKNFLTRLQVSLDGGKHIQEMLLVQWRTGFQLMLLGDDDAALVLLEQTADERTRRGKVYFHDSYCRNCYTRNPDQGVLLKCRTCPPRIALRKVSS